MTTDTLTQPTQAPSTLPTGRATAPARTRRRRFDGAMIVLASPAVIWFCAFMVFPLFAMFYLSLNNWAGLISPRTFAGLDVYRKVFADPVFWTALRNTFVQVGVAVPVMVFFAIMVSYYLMLKPRGADILRVAFFTPALMSLSAKSMMFMGVFSPDGLINSLLTSIGLSSWTHSWLASESTVLGAIIAIDVWSGIGFTAVLLSARMSGLPYEIFEAAQLDGAGHWRRMWRVAFPMMRDYVGTLAMLQFLWTTFSSAGTILLLTRGGPGTSSMTLSYLVYSKAFLQSQVGYSQVVGVILFVFGITGMYLIKRAFRPAV